MNTQNAQSNDAVDCAPIYHIRETQGLATQGGFNPNDSKAGGPNNSSNSTGISTSLPSRHREASNNLPCQKFGNQGDKHLFPQALPVSVPNTDTNGSTGMVDIDMDFSSDPFGLGEKNPPSDHPTPSTLNSSSNTSYSISGLDNHSPGQNSQKMPAYAGLSFDKVQPVHISPASSGSPQIPDMGSIGGQSLPTSTTSPQTSGSSNAFTMPSVWDMNTPNTDISNIDFGSVNVDSLSDAQWAQILNNSGNAPGWDNWRSA